MKKKAGIFLGLLCVGYGVTLASELDVMEETSAVRITPTGSPSLKQKILKFINLPKPQTDQGRVERLKELGRFILQNKGCLSGEGCSVRTSLAMNYLLGVAVRLALYAMFKVLRADDLKDLQTGLAAIATLIIEQAISLGYEHVIDKSEFSYFACMNVKKCSVCLISGKNCNLATRRKLFFHAGRWSTILTASVISKMKERRTTTHQERVGEGEPPPIKFDWKRPKGPGPFPVWS